MAEIAEIEVTEFEKILKQGAALIDVREPDETAQGIIESALLFPLSQFPEICEKLPSNQDIIFYCRSGRRSLKAAELASKWTDRKLYNLTGGYEAYKVKA